jgi:hypothetical protein
LYFVVLNRRYEFIFLNRRFFLFITIVIVIKQTVRSRERFYIILAKITSKCKFFSIWRVESIKRTKIRARTRHNLIRSSIVVAWLTEMGCTPTVPCGIRAAELALIVDVMLTMFFTV